MCNNNISGRREKYRGWGNSWDRNTRSKWYGCV